MNPLTINDINPKSDEFYNFKNFIGIQKPKEKSVLEKLEEKIKKNTQRDLANTEALMKLGFRVFTVWECEVKTVNLGQLVATLKRRG